MYKSFLNTRVTFNMRSILICCKYILLLFHLFSFHYLLLTKYTLSFFYTKAPSVPPWFHQKTQPKRGEMEIVFFRQWRRAGANTLLKQHSSRWSLIQQICKGPGCMVLWHSQTTLSVPGEGRRDPVRLRGGQEQAKEKSGKESQVIAGSMF